MTLSVIHLREVADDDLPIFFEQQDDPQANHLAGFPARPREIFMTHWRKILADADNMIRTIVCNGEIAGYMAGYGQPGERQVGYWLGRAYWGRGIASAALPEFLMMETSRPLHAHVAKHNHASIRVLEKCGFAILDEDNTVPATGGDPVAEWIMILRA